MKVLIQSPDDKNRIDGTMQRIFDFIPDQVSSVGAADVVIVPISFFHDYKFNPLLRDIDKPVVIVDMMELEWNAPEDTMIFGVNHEGFTKWLGRDDWQMFGAWCREKAPIVYFKRELFSKHAAVPSNLRPMSWPCLLEDAPFQSEDEFNTRRLEVIWMWGLSHPSRPNLHADIFRAMNTHGIGVISDTLQWEGHFRDHPHARTWMSVFTPWHTRKPIADVLWYQRQAKLSVSLFGCGRVCFRHSEAPVQSIMSKQIDGIAFPFPWEGGKNCIDLRVGHEFEDLEAATHRKDLYGIYLQSQQTIDKYRPKRLAVEYMLPEIEKALPKQEVQA